MKLPPGLVKNTVKGALRKRYSMPVWAYGILAILTGASVSLMVAWDNGCTMELTTEHAAIHEHHPAQKKPLTSQPASVDD